MVKIPLTNLVVKNGRFRRCLKRMSFDLSGMLRLSDQSQKGTDNHSHIVVGLFEVARNLVVGRQWIDDL